MTTETVATRISGSEDTAKVFATIREDLREGKISRESFAQKWDEAIALTKALREGRQISVTA